MQSGNIIQDIQQIVNFFRIDLISEVAKATKFIQRLRKLSAITFLGMFTFGLVQRPDASLTQLVGIGKQITPNFSMTPEGLHQKITDKAVDFLKTLFAKSLKISAETAETFMPILKHFPKVHLLDSTIVSLPEELSQEFPGSGGSAPNAALKFQFMLEYKSGNFSKIWLTGGIQPDQKQMDVAIENIKKGELLIHDLGYFSQSGIMKIKEKEAFFLSRYYPQTALYRKTKNGDFKRFDLLEALGKSEWGRRRVVEGVPENRDIAPSIAPTLHPAIGIVMKEQHKNFGCVTGQKRKFPVVLSPNVFARKLLNEESVKNVRQQRRKDGHLRKKYLLCVIGTYMLPMFQNLLCLRN